MNKNIAILGCAFGDEAKSRCAHYLAKRDKYDYIVRFSGSANAGHTLYHNGQKIVRHLLPSADFSIVGQKAFLASGMVIDLHELYQEVLETEKIFPGAAARIIVDPDAFIVSPKHIEEDKEKNKHIGSTNKGVTPAYKDKIGRTGTKIRQLIQDNAEIIQELKKLGVQFRYVAEMQVLFEKSKIMFEGSQSIHLDYNFGNYPFVTSGECGLGGIYNSGFAFVAPSKVYGISKGSYQTKAGGGESKFVAEMPDEEAKLFRERGNEIGATTSRPRRVGYLDLPLLKYGIMKGGITHLILTKLDISNGLQNIKICSSYKNPMFSGNDYEQAEPFYTTISGWKDAKDLSQIAPLLQMIEDYTDTPIEFISVGVNDEDMISLEGMPPMIAGERRIALKALQEQQAFFENGRLKYHAQSRFIDPFETAPLAQAIKTFDNTMENSGYPPLKEIMGEIIKKKINKNGS